MSKGHVITGMSGGVDSSVAAFLLKSAGWEVTGVTMLLCAPADSSSVEKARSVAEGLGISFETADYRDEFRASVMDAFVSEYESGRTPNPCVICNRTMKFGKMYDDFSERLSDKLSDESPLMIATGHYARIEKGTDSNGNTRWMLGKAADLSKDQTYFLCGLSQETLSHTLFPLGSLTKDEVRRIAAAQGFANARTKDSQDVCFIPDGDYAGFIKKYTGHDYAEGNFVDMDGNVLGRHKGIINYTIGQRKGLGIALGKPAFVYRIDTERNEVVLADDSDLYTEHLTVSDFNWVSIDNPGQPFRALCRIRYRHREAPCTVTPLAGSRISITFDEPQRAVTPGQTAVLYDIEKDLYVLGGGTIIR